MNRKIYISVPFTWNLPDVKAELSQRSFNWDQAVVGGPAVKQMPEYLGGVAEIRDHMDGILQKVNPLATRSTLGCPNNCKFCGVDRIEPEYIELEDWPDLPVYCDNNILAASWEHFCRVVDRLKKYSFSDFNQGLDARLMSEKKARKLAEIPGLIARLAWDSNEQAHFVKKAVEMLIDAGIPKKRIRCYVLLNWESPPETILIRFEWLRRAGIMANPMRYQPLDCLVKNSFVACGWTQQTIADYMRFWGNDRYYRQEDFNTWRKRQRRRSLSNKTGLLFKEGNR